MGGGASRVPHALDADLTRGQARPTALLGRGRAYPRYATAPAAIARVPRAMLLCPLIRGGAQGRALSRRWNDIVTRKLPSRASARGLFRAVPVGDHVVPGSPHRPARAASAYSDLFPLHSGSPPGLFAWRPTGRGLSRPVLARRPGRVIGAVGRRLRRPPWLRGRARARAERDARSPSGTRPSALGPLSVAASTGAHPISAASAGSREPRREHLQIGAARPDGPESWRGASPLGARPDLRRRSQAAPTLSMSSGDASSSIYEELGLGVEP